MNFFGGFLHMWKERERGERERRERLILF